MLGGTASSHLVDRERAALSPSFRAIAWIEDALAPLRTSTSDDEVHQLAIAIRSVEGLEAFAWRSSGTPKTGFA